MARGRKCVQVRMEFDRFFVYSISSSTAALKQLRTLQAVDNTAKGKSAAKKTVGDCCICECDKYMTLYVVSYDALGLFTVSVCQSLFIAPCSHAFHYKCIRPLLELHHPGFSCPLCRTFADLEADVEVDETELKAIEDALDEAEEEDLVAVATEPNGKGKGVLGASADDAIEVDSDNGPAQGQAPVGQTGNRVPAPPVVTTSTVPTLGHQQTSTGADDDRQVEDELEVDFDEDEDERMVSGSADEFGGRLQAGGDAGEDYMDTTYSPDKRNGHMPFSNNSRNPTPGVGPSNARDIPLRINSAGVEESVGEREARELADA